MEDQERAIDRLKKFAQYARYELKMVKGYNSFEAYCGMSLGYMASLDKNGKGKGKIGSDTIAKVLNKFPMLNIEWLCTGKGDMLKKDVIKENEEHKVIQEITMILKRYHNK